MEKSFFNENTVHADLNDIQFSDIFVLEEIQKLQDMFSEATCVASIITHPDGTPITTPSNFCKLCSEIIRATEKGLMNCYKSDAELGRHNPTGPIVRTCFSGDLWDAGASITVGGKHIANWLIGQVKNEKSNIHHMMRYADEIGADKEEYSKALNEIPEMSFDRFNTVANMLFHFANEMSEKAYSSYLLKKQIEEREKVTAMLVKSEEKYRMLVENSHDVIYTLDMEGFITYTSPVVTSLLGYPVNRMVGKYFKQFIHAEDLDHCLDSIRRVRESKKIFNIEYRIRHQDGSWRWHASGGLPIKDEDGRVTGFYGIARDVTLQKLAETEIRQKNEELLKSNLVKDRFFSIIAHDLKSPFGSLVGLSRILAEERHQLPPEQVQQIIENIHGTTENLYCLLENLLQWAKIQQNLIPVEPDCLYLLTVVEDSLLLFKETSKNKNISIDVDIPADLMVYTDVNFLQTIVRNLVSNSLKFTPKGGRIYISTRMLDVNQVEISVRDTGIGMSPEILDNLFRPDIQTGRVGTENEPSNGLGLLLCKEFVEMQGGKIYAESEFGTGTTFYFSVPSILIENSIDLS